MEYVAKDMRKRAGKKLKGFGVCQGACYGNGKLYIAFERGNGKKNHAIRIARYSWPSLKCEKVSKNLQLGHANDMTYRNGLLYVTHSGGKKYRYLHIVNADTLKKRDHLKIKVPKKYGESGGFSGITTYGSGYLLRLLTTKQILILNKRFEVKGAFSVKKHWKIANGMTMKGRELVRTYSIKQDENKQRIAYFDVKGNCTKTKKLKVKAEMEGAFVVDDVLYLTFYKKKKVNGKTKKECWIVKV